MLTQVVAYQFRCESEILLNTPSYIEQLVSKIATDLDGLYLDELCASTLAHNPRIVAAIIPECRVDYMEWLLESNPEIGCSIIYGTLVLRRGQFFDNAIDAAREVIARANDFAEPSVQLIRYSIGVAIQKENIADQTRADVAKDEVERLEANYWCTEKDDFTRISSIFPSYQYFQKVIDEYAILSQGNLPITAPLIGESDGKSMETYLAVVFGMLSAKNSPLQQSASELFKQLDPALFEVFEPGLKEFYYG